MSYKTILAHLEVEGDNESVLGITRQLAERFDARVIGIAAGQPIQPLYDEGCSTAEVVAIDRTELDEELAACGVQFRTALEGYVREIEWRSTITYQPLSDYIADQARCADLIVTGKDIGVSLFDNTRRVDIGDLAFRAGRPVLIVPQGISRLALQHVYLGWKDTREARRAAADAMPLFQAAGHVTVLEVAADKAQAHAQAHVKDVALWLNHHNVSATPRAVGASDNRTEHLRAELTGHKCDLLVAGAYGHNRLGEWVFGGVTEDILLDPDFCVLLSH